MMRIGSWRLGGPYYTVPSRRAMNATHGIGEGAVVSYANLAHMFFTRAAELAERPRYRYFDQGAWREVTWAAMAERVRNLAAAFIEDGVQPGDRVALLSATRPEWMEVDLAILAAGAVTLPV